MTVLNNRLSLFLCVSFGFSWICWFCIPLFHLADSPRLALITLGVLGPSLAALATGNRPVRSVKTEPASHLRWLVVLVIAVIVAASWYLRARGADVTHNPYHLREFLASPFSLVIVALNILVAAWLVVYFRVFKLRRRDAAWSLVGFVFFPLLMTIAWLICRWFHVPVSTKLEGVDVQTVVLATSVALPAIFALNAGIEEPGWRGFLQNWFERDHSILRSTVYTGIIWGTWHLPLHFTGFYGGGVSPMNLLTRFVVNICLSIVIACFYHRSRKLLLVAMLLHTMSNVSISVFPQNGLI